MICPVSAAATAVSGETRYTWSPAVPLRPAKLRLNVRRLTAPSAGREALPDARPAGGLQDPRPGRDQVGQGAVARPASPAPAGCPGRCPAPRPGAPSGPSAPRPRASGRGSWSWCRSRSAPGRPSCPASSATRHDVVRAEPGAAASGSSSDRSITMRPKLDLDQSRRRRAGRPSRRGSSGGCSRSRPRRARRAGAW